MNFPTKDMLHKKQTTQHDQYLTLKVAKLSTMSDPIVVVVQSFHWYYVYFFDVNVNVLSLVLTRMQRLKHRILVQSLVLLGFCMTLLAQQCIKCTNNPIF